MKAGDSVRVEVLEGGRPVREVRVAALSQQYMGMGVYLRQEALNRLLREGPAISSALLAIDDRQADTIYQRLPGHAGGVVGYVFGPLSMRLGFVASGVLWICALVTALPLALQFSWVAAADSLGAWIDGYRERRIEKREIAEDVRLGELAQRKREIEVEEEREEFEEHTPLVIEPPVLEVPKSERVARERHLR